MVRVFVLLVLMLSIAEVVFADGEQVCDVESGCKQEIEKKRTFVPKLDKRLPPVIPGQVVEVDGQKIKVWSSSGPVPVSNPPEPWREFNSRTYVDTPRDLEVIVDDRKNKETEGKEAEEEMVERTKNK